jgi:uncharacterized protein
LIVVDTSALYAGFVEREAAHTRVAAATSAEQPPFVLSPFVLAELGYLLTSRGGVARELAALRSVAAGAFELASLDLAELAAATDLIERYRDLGIGLTDASLVVLAERYGTRRILTLDRRRFGALRTSGGEPFELVP